MLIKNSDDIKSSELTDQKTYLNRRVFMRGAVLAGSVAATGFVYRKLNPPAAELPKGETIQPATGTPPAESSNAFTTNEARTSLTDITNYNNFYEFSTEKRAVAAAATGFVTRPWTVAVEGMVNKPKVFDLDELL